jgi:hypothetical protein
MGCGLPDVARGPVGEGAELEDGFAAGEGEVGDFEEFGAAAGLFATEAGEPDFIFADGFEERLDFAEGAAAVGGGLVEDTEGGFLLGYGFFGEQVGEVEMPVGGDAVAIGVGVGEVVAGVEEEDGDVGAQFEGELEEEDVFGLEAAGEADVMLRGVVGEFEGEEVADVLELGLEVGGEGAH